MEEELLNNDSVENESVTEDLEQEELKKFKLLEKRKP